MSDDPDDLARRLPAERPTPRAAWRGELRRSIVAGATPPARPARLRLLVAAYGASGLALLSTAAALGL
jgi:hypothetical protein